MEFGQESITTLHDYGTADPAAPTGRASVVVPMIALEGRSEAASRLFDGLATIDPLEVIVPLRGPPGPAVTTAAWLESLEAPVDPLYCGGDRLNGLLDDNGYARRNGKGADVWLALGAARGDYVVLHDADARSYEPRDTRKLLAPLATDGPCAIEGAAPATFVKGYYARVEADRLYGRLTRLLYDPLIRAIAADHDHPLVEYLAAFRYALAGETAMTAAVARSLPIEPRWGLEVGALGAAFTHAGPDRTAQVDLGRYVHDHRSVTGPGGLSEVSNEVTGALFRALEDRELAIQYDRLRSRYREIAKRFVRAYAADAAFNDLEPDPIGEREQVQRYAEAVAPPGPDERLPAFQAADISATAVRDAARADLEAARDGASVAQAFGG